jgi:hypothetical protein
MPCRSSPEGKVQSIVCVDVDRPVLVDRVDDVVAIGLVVG